MPGYGPRLACRRPGNRPGPHRVGLIRWGGGLPLILLLLGAPLGAQGTPAGTRITGIATVIYEAENGLVFTELAEGGAEFVVARVGGVSVDPPGVSTTDPGSTVVFRHTLHNIGNAPDSFTVAAFSPAAWPVRIHLDSDRNGRLDSGEPLLSGPIALEYDGSAELLLAVEVPNQAALRGTIDTLRLIGRSRFDPAATDSVLDQVRVRTAGIVIALEKAVDRSSAAAGDILTYTIAYRAEGPGTASEFRVVDPIPPGTRYVAGTLRLNGAPLTDPPGDDAGSYDPVANQIAVALATIAGGDIGAVTFQVRVTP